MPLPNGVDAVTLNAGTNGLANPDGTPAAGTVTLTPSVERVVSSTDGLIILGPVNATLSASGTFTLGPVLATDADGFEPSGWTYRVDENFTGQPPRSYSISLPAAAPTVALPDITPVSTSTGTVTASGVSSVNGHTGTVTLTAADVGADTTGAATAAVSAHVAATDPHGDRAYTDTQTATRAAAATQIIAGTGLTGGGTLAADRTLNVAYGASAGTACEGDDTRLSNSRTPTGPAGGDLSGTYPNPTVAAVDGVAVSGTPATGQVLTATGAAAASWQDAASSTGAWVFDVTSSAYGAAGDGRMVTDGAMSSGSATLTSATAAFTAGDVGKVVLVKGAGASGVTTLVTTVSAYNSATSVTLADANASGGSVSGALVMWASDDTAAIQAAIDAAGAYAAVHGAATVYIPVAPAGRFYGIGGALVTGGSTLGNAQLTLPVVATTGNKAVLVFEGPADGAAVQHWEQTVPQLSGATLVSFGVFASGAAQIASINAAGNACVIGGPSQPGGYGVSPGVFSNMHITLRNLSILTTHSANGLTYGAADLSGVANAAIENVAYGTAGTVAGGDYNSPGGFANGLCPGLLLPASGNNDLVLLRNVTCHGGYTYGVFATEHCDIYGMRILYCWSAFCPVGTYYSSVGSTHAIVATLLSIEACTYLVYVIGAGSGGIGPFLHLRIDTETSTPKFGDNNSGFASSTARGDVVLTGLYTRTGLTLDHPVGYDILDGQLSYPAVATTGTYTVSTFDESVQADASSGGFTVTLPTAAGRCRRLLVTKTDASGNAVTVAAAGSETVNGSASTSLAAQWDSVELLPLASGGGWIAR
jgi:hypothetical protein